jgi:hypothetical protein
MTRLAQQIIRAIQDADAAKRTAAEIAKWKKELARERN